MSRRGIQLAVVSKNDESTALLAIDRHPEMVLRRNDLIAWRINWNDKAENISDLLAEVNLGAASAVFIDDNPAERERVKMALPQVLVPDWPEDPSQYVQALHGMGCFDVTALTNEDRQRTTMYVTERARTEVKQKSATVEDWLESIETKVVVEPLSEENLNRVAQLYNKTNQLNLTTRRLSAAEISAWAKSPERRIWTISVKDRFGDMGLTGVIGLERRGEDMILVDYILSCRVMGRQVEESMFYLAVEWARIQQTKRLVANYRPTERNRPTLEVLHKAQLPESQPGEFVWLCEQSYLRPRFLHLEINPGVLE
jgi:FkbH-like protein